MMLVIIIAIVVILLLLVLSTYNSLVKLNNKVEEAFSTMDVYLKKRICKTWRKYIKRNS